MEIWKDIKEYEGLYQVSNLGNVKSLNYRKTDKEKILKQTIYKNGYSRVLLSKNGIKKLKYVHRLVAEAFIPMDEYKNEIDHINCNRSDNRIKNLRWSTRKENCNNPITLKSFSNASKNRVVSDITKLKISLSNKGRKPSQETIEKFIKSKSKSIIQFTLDGDFIKIWNSATIAEKEIGSGGNISKCCLGKQKTAYGYKWGFEKDYEPIQFKVFDLKIYKKVS